LIVAVVGDAPLNINKGIIALDCSKHLVNGGALMVNCEKFNFVCGRFTINF